QKLAHNCSDDLILGDCKVGSEECGEGIEHWIILQTVDRRETTYRPRILRTLRRRSSDAEDWRSARCLGTENDRKRRWSSTNTLGDRREITCQRQGLYYINVQRCTLRLLRISSYIYECNEH